MNDFKALLKNASENELLIMQNNHSSYTPDQVIMLVKEIDDRALTSDESEDLKKMYGYEEQVYFDEPDSEFEKDISFLVDKEASESRKQKLMLTSQVLGLVMTLGFVFILFGGPRMLGIDNDLYFHFIRGFSRLLPFIIIEFFLFWGFFIGKKFLISIIAFVLVVITLTLGTIVF